jgi:hypothetical protein
VTEAELRQAEKLAWIAISPAILRFLLWIGMFECRVNQEYYNE